jgi:osmotically-inducible protein OsmY
MQLARACRCLALLVLSLPTPTFAGNHEIAMQIADRLRDSGRLHGFRIDVRFQDGEAIIAGSVRSQEQIETAVRIAKEIREVRSVVNQLKVDPEVGKPIGPTFGDPEAGKPIGPEFKARTLFRVGGRFYEYELRDGTVTLRGRVASREQMELVVQAVKDRLGASQVVNQLEIAPGDDPHISAIESLLRAPGDGPRTGVTEAIVRAFLAALGCR